MATTGTRTVSTPYENFSQFLFSGVAFTMLMAIVIQLLMLLMSAGSRKRKAYLSNEQI